MRIRGRALALVAVLALLGAAAGPALAEGPVGPDPASNFTLNMSALPQACWTDGTGAACEAAGIQYLDAARANLGQPPYALPGTFTSLPPIEQVFVLTNLDRIHYGLRPITGLAAVINRDAAAGVRNQTDPQPSSRVWNAYTSNWAGGYPNILLAYGGWMYDDGLGSGNLDCTANNTSGCWGHRHDILWRFAPLGALAMGAAAGNAGGMSGFTTLLEQWRPSLHPTYNYLWTQAVAAGAGK
jgi:hypothetical protein